MIGNVIRNIYAPDKAEWFMLETDIGIYSLRLGGVKKENSFNSSLYEKLEIPVGNKTIVQLYTDDFCVFIETTDGDAIHHSDNASIDSEGKTSFGLFYLPIEEFLEIKREYESSENGPLKIIKRFD